MHPTQVRAIPISDILKTTGFRRNERVLLEQATRLFAELREKGKTMHDSSLSGAMLIGGFATRFYAQERFKGRISGNKTPTDLDIAMETLPSSLSQFLNENKAIERTGMRYGSMGTEPISLERDTDYQVYHIRKEYAERMPNYAGNCFFFGIIGPIIIRAEDIAKAREITISATIEGHEITSTLRIADPGFLLATMLNPSATTYKRAFRAAIILASLDSVHFIEARDRYVEVVKTSGLTAESINKTLQVFDTGEFKSETFKHAVTRFIEGVKQALGA